MDNLYQNNNPTGAQAHRGEINGQQGTWVPVKAETVPFPVSNDASRPTIAPDGNYYYGQGGAPIGGNGGPAPIAANQNNAIPTPSSIVQLPPIVQPIALVPFASQNQPLVQYDSNYREEIPRTNLEPIYRAKPYAGLSVLCILLGVVICVVMCLIACLGSGSTGLDTVFGLLVLFGVGSFTSTYYTGVLSKVFADGFTAGFSANLNMALMSFLVPVFYAISILLAILAIIYYLVKLGKSESPRHFSVVTLLGLIFSAANVVIMFLADGITPDIGAYVIAGLFLVLLIVPFFARKGAQVIDYSASKRLYEGEKH